MPLNFPNFPGAPPGFYAQGTVTVGTTATLIATITATSGSGVVVQNNNTVAVFLGGSNVTTTGATQGIQLAAGATITIPVLGNAQLALYGIVAATAGPVSFLYPQA